MSGGLASARRMLDAAAIDLAMWRPRDEAYRAALKRMAADPKVERVVAGFGGKYSLAPAFVRQARRDPGEEAMRRMMHAAASVFADRTARMVPAREIVKKREEIERESAKSKALAAFAERDAADRDSYLSGLDALASILAPLDDPIVERRRPPVIAKRRKGAELPSDEALLRARGVLARVRGGARLIFGKVGDRVADAFVEAATGIPFSRDDARGERGRGLRRDLA
jgi:hypothetical protein